MYCEGKLYSRCYYISCTMKASCLHYHHVETILVEQVLEASPVVTRFDNSGADPEPEIVNEGKPRFMH